MPELIKVHRQTQLAGLLVACLGHTAGEQLANLRDVVLTQIGAVHFQLVHDDSCYWSHSRATGTARQFSVASGKVLVPA